MTTAEKARQMLIDAGVQPEQFTSGSFWQGVLDHLAATIEAAVTVAVARHEEANQRAGEILLWAMLPCTVRRDPVDYRAVASAAGLLSSARLSTHPLPTETTAELRMEVPWRRLLWLRHGCSIAALYGDDGEMQCSPCGLDFRRMPAAEIEATWRRTAERALAAERKE